MGFFSKLSYVFLGALVYAFATRPNKKSFFKKIETEKGKGLGMVMGSEKKIQTKPNQTKSNQTKPNRFRVISRKNFCNSPPLLMLFSTEIFVRNSRINLSRRE